MIRFEATKACPNRICIKINLPMLRCVFSYRENERELLLARKFHQCTNNDMINAVNVPMPNQLRFFHTCYFCIVTRVLANASKQVTQFSFLKKFAHVTIRLFDDKPAKCCTIHFVFCSDKFAV